METPVTPFADERRVEERLDFLRECQVEIRSPTWAVLPGFLMGETRNITMHGVLFALEGFSRALFLKWANHLKSGGSLGVVVRFQEGEDFIELPGDIVWALLREEYDGSDVGTCEAGVLLSLLEMETANILRRVIRELDA